MPFQTTVAMVCLFKSAYYCLNYYCLVEHILKYYDAIFIIGNNLLQVCFNKINYYCLFKLTYIFMRPTEILLNDASTGEIDICRWTSSLMSLKSLSMSFMTVATICFFIVPTKNQLLFGIPPLTS
jgi:hypothetical protein